MRKVMLIILIAIPYIISGQGIFDSPQEYYDKGTSYNDIGEYDSAICIYNEGINCYPNNSLILSGLAYSYYRKGDFDTAIDYCNKSIKADAKNVYPLIYLGYIYLDMESYQKSIDVLTNAIGIETDNDFLYLRRAMAFFKGNDIQNAIIDLEKAISLNPENWGAFSLLAYIFSNNQSYTKAIEYAKKALAINEKSELALWVVNKCQEIGVTAGDSSIINLNITINIDSTIDKYINDYPYLQAISLNMLIDGRIADKGIIIKYIFNEYSKLLQAIVFEYRSKDRFDIYKNYLTQWIEMKYELREEKGINGENIVLNLTPTVVGDNTSVTQGLILTSDCVTHVFYYERTNK